jgi:tetratricopeptide (TPR) repeat protein
MSLTTIAAPIPPEARPNLPPSQPETFQRSDLTAAAIVFVVTTAVYIATLAPSVTLEDSGELITAATKFGVPHQPGYPLWTMSGFILSHLIPVGNLAWRINLQSALYGGIANALLTLLVCHSGRWLLQRWTDPALQAAVRPYCFYAGLLAGLTLGFSDVMWSQATIAAVHGTVNALFTNIILLLLYFWMLEPAKTERLIITVFVFGLGLTHHHTLIQIIPAILVAAALLRAGVFWSVFLAVNLFSLSILIYLAWLSDDDELHRISWAMSLLILSLTAIVSFFYLAHFRRRLFLFGALLACLFFAYANYVMSPSEFDNARILHPGAQFWLYGTLLKPGWLQFTNGYAVCALLLTCLAFGLLFTSNLNRRLIIGVFAAGWVGLTPYAYEPFASSTHPPINWGYPQLRTGFYYDITRGQYPMSLPNLIKNTIGKAIRVVPAEEERDAGLGRPNYFHRLELTFYYYADNLQKNFTVPLIFLTLAIFIYIRRCDSRQTSWFIFLGLAFFFLGFMLNLIEPPESFDFERNLQYKVFHLQSHCIFVLLMGYGALAAMVYLHENLPEIPARTGLLGFGMPALFLSLLPLWSNFDDCNKSGHWFGYEYGYDIMQPMDKNAVYYGGSDPGRFVPTFMAFVESQQDPRWKSTPGFDRRDVTVITQNALIDASYCRYIREQYDPRFRPATFTPFEKWLGRDQAYPKIPVICASDDELAGAMDQYRSLNAARIKADRGIVLRLGTSDVYEADGIVARQIFEKNKKTHTFYVEQSYPIQWMYPYLIPSGLIFKMNPEEMTALPPAAVRADYAYWDACCSRLLGDPKFRLDDEATTTFAKLAYWHADLYHWRKMEAEEEHFLKAAISLCPQLGAAINDYASFLVQHERYDEALALVKQAQLDDPRNETYEGLLEFITASQGFGEREKEIRRQLALSPYDVQINLNLARLLEEEGKFSEVGDRLRIVAGLTNWTREDMGDVVRYYVDTVRDPDAAIAFLEARVKIDPKASEVAYYLAGLNASVGRNDEAIKYLTQSIATAGTNGNNALVSASVDTRFDGLRNDPRFQKLIETKVPPLTNAAKTPSDLPPEPVQR